MQRPKSIAQRYNNNNTNNQSFQRMTTPSESNWNVNDDGLRDIPTFYPLDRNSIFVHDKPSNVANRISECCRVMSIQAIFDDGLATADLKTSEHVDIHISLWKGEQHQHQQQNTTNINATLNTGDINTEQIEVETTTNNNNSNNNNTPVTIVEAQRRNGDAVAYHKYCRNLFSAADGTFSTQGYLSLEQEEQVKMQKRSSILQGLKQERSRRKLHEEQDVKDDTIRASGIMICPIPPVCGPGGGGGGSATPFLVEAEDSLLALEIAASLLKKDRMDARQLGIETLCLLTDPIKAGMQTALLASKVVLFGSVDAGTEINVLDDDYIPSEDLGIREAILSLVQFGKLGEYADFDDVVEDDHDNVEEVGNSNVNPEDKEFNALLHNLALAVLANALDVLEQSGDQMGSIGTNKGSTFATSTSVSATASGNEETATANTTNVSTFLEETQEISKKELLSTLLNVLGRAESKPHDACLSAQCLKSLFQASRRAKRRARDLNAKQIVNTALDVGRRTHIKLETETKKIMRELERTDDMDDRNNNDSQDEDDSDGDYGRGD